MSEAFYPEVDKIGTWRREAQSTIPQIKCLCELVDNALDAKATRIDIVFNGSECRVSDNGCGISRNDVQNVFTYGTSKSAGRVGKLGRYGVGMKQAFAKLGTTFRIVSKAEGSEAFDALMDLTECAELGDLVGRVEDCSKNNLGTIIKINGRSNGRCRVTPDMLAKKYIAAHKNGIAITLNGKKLPKIDWPALSLVRKELVTHRGLKAVVTAGMLPESGENEFNGYWITYEGRTIYEQYTGAGYGNHAPTNFFCHIELIDSSVEGSPKWPLATNKDYSDEIDEFLDTTVFHHVVSILKECEEKGRELRFNLRFQNVARDLENIFLGKGKIEKEIEKRKSPEERGGERKPSNPDPERERKPRNTHRKPRSGGVTRIEIGDVPHQDKEVLGYVRRFGGCIKVCLNNAYPAYEEISKNEDSIFAYAISLLSDYLIREEVGNQPYLGFDEIEDDLLLGKVVGKLLLDRVNEG